MAAGASPGMVVKNTFLEVGNHESVLEMSDWRRQMSDPGAFQRQMSELTNATASDGEPLKIFTKDTSEAGDTSQGECLLDSLGGEENSLAAKMADSFAAAMAQQQGSSGELGELSMPAGADIGGKPPQILLLADSIPRGRKNAGANKDSKVSAAERKDARLKDSQINQIKNFDITTKEPPWTDVTTVMMRNLPNKYTQQMLLEELQDSGFRAAIDFDFFYLPMDHSNAANLGYCFINFTATAMANAFAAAFQLKRMRRFNSNKTVVVMPASIQGYERNHAYYSSTRVVQAEDPQYRPLFMKNTSASRGGGGVSTAGSRGTQGGAKGNGKAAGGVDSTASSRADKKAARSKGIKGGAFPQALGAELDMPYSTAPSTMPLASELPPLAGTAPWPAPPGASSQDDKVVCSSCSSECSSSHRFCAFCGAPISAPEPSPLMPMTPAAAMALQHSSMRADAPTFVMPLPGDPGLPGPGLPGPAAHATGFPPALLLPSPETASDELDIMRGRLMLLAALKEMQSREAANSTMAY